MAAAALVVGTPTLGSAAVAHPGPAVVSPTILVSDRPTVPGGATPMGALPARRVLSGVVVLQPSHPAALAALAAAVSTPGSKLYHRYLPAGRFAEAFGPSPAALAAVERQLRRGGLVVSAVAGNDLAVDFRGPVGRVARTFGTSMAAYRLADGRPVFANTTGLRLPAAIARSVQAVIGLNDLLVPHAVGPDRAAPPARPVPTVPARATARPVAAPGAGKAGPAASKGDPAVVKAGPVACAAATDTANGSGGLTDTQIAHAYGADPLYAAGATGGGQTIAVYELESYNTSAVRKFDACYFGAARATAMLARVRTVTVDGGLQAGPGSGEAALDIEDVSAFAPGASLDVYEAPPTYAGYLDEWNAIVSGDRARVVTSSYSTGCETEVAGIEPGLEQAENAIFEQAAVQGQSILEASGDAGSDECGDESAAPVAPYLSGSDPATQPYVTAVGGTTIEDATNPPSEQVWNDGANGNDFESGGAGGGGISAVWPEPAWQSASRVPGIDNPTIVRRAETVSGGDFCWNRDVRTACRETPDVSAQADEYTGAVTIFVDGSWLTVGGTSSSTPLWAAMLADVDSTRTCQTDGGVGWVNPALYAIAAVPSEYAASFNDIRVSNNDMFGANDGLYPATTGYDMATGLGSPRLTGTYGRPGLAYYLCAPPATVRPTVSGIAPAAVSSAAGTGTGPAGAAVTVTVTGTGFETRGVPDVAGLTVGTYAVGEYTVTGPTTLTFTAPPGAVQEGNGNAGAGGGTYDVGVTLTGGETSLPTSGARLVVIGDPDGTGASVPVVLAVDPSGGLDSGGTVVHVYGSGFTVHGGATAVTIGGVPASFTAVSDTQIVATVPPQSSGAGGTVCQGVEHPAGDVCQTQVQVRTATGTSAETTIYPEVDQPAFTAEGLPTTEGVVASQTEFDYLPPPHVSAVVYDPVSPAVASEAGESFVTVTGSGFGALGFEWVDVGPPGRQSSVDDEVFSETPTSLTLVLPGIAATTQATWRDLAVQTLASPNVAAEGSEMEPSNVARIVYAPTPEVTAIATPSHKPFGPTSGGTRLTVTGTGFVDGVYVAFESGDGPSSGTDYDVTLSSTTPGRQLSLVTPAEQPGADEVMVCNVSGCSGQQTQCGGDFCVTSSSSPGPPGDIFTYFPPGAPRVQTVSPRSGPPGSTVTITGVDLDEPQAVYFGSIRDTEVTNGQNPTTGAPETDVVTAVVPNGVVGRTVAVRVVTAESLMRQKNPKSPLNKRVEFTFTGT